MLQTEMFPEQRQSNIAGGIKLYLADCREADGSEGHVMITDPPYREHVHKKAVSQSPGRGVRVRNLGFGCLTPEVRDHIGRITGRIPRWSIIYSDIESLADWRNCLSGTYIRALPWVRWSMPQLSGDRPTSGCEMLTIAWGSQKGKKSWNGPGNLTHLAHKCLRGEGKHKTEKPLDQALDLVEFFSDPGETVFDPFMGHGTIGLACKILGRGYVGLDIDPKCYEVATARIHAETLSKRDSKRYARYLAAKQIREEEAVKIAANTARVRAKAERAA